MDKQALREAIRLKLSVRIQRMGLGEADLTDDLDLVRSGVLDSLGFVDLVADLEGITGKRVDLEKALDRKGATSLGGVIELFF